jgi:exopolysaccharide biosynthesis polyprenyl glycosylphosphotransferase
MKTWATSILKRRQFELLLGDVFIFILSFVGAVLIRYTQVDLSFGEFMGRTSFWIVAPFMLLLYLGAFYVLNLYGLRPEITAFRRFFFILGAAAIVLLATASVMFVAGGFPIGRVILFFQAPFMVAGASLWRAYFFKRILPVQIRRRLAVIGVNPTVDGLVEELDSLPVQEYEIARVWQDSDEAHYGSGDGGTGTVAAPIRHSLVEAMREAQADVLVCSIDRNTPEDLLYEALWLRQDGVDVYDLPSFFSQYSGRIPVSTIDTFWVLQTVKQNRPGTASERIRRVIDLTVGTLGCFLAAPIMLAIALAIKLDSKGPVLFKQERLGLHEKPFTLYKFRSMRPDAEKLTGPKWAEEDDPRITRVGRFLRKSRLDELPQLYNILKGDMTIVGTRPIRRHFADLLEREVPYYRLRFSIKPGLTGWPQVQHDYAGTVEGQIRKFEYELFYLANRSLVLDLYIILKTIQVMLFGRGQ